MKRAILILAFAISGCATGYQAKGLTGGYEDVELGDGKYIVRFEGNGFTNDMTALRFATRRAKELCAEQKMKANFLSIDQDAKLMEIAGAQATCYGNSYRTTCSGRGAQMARKPIAQVAVQCSEEKVADVKADARAPGAAK